MMYTAYVGGSLIGLSSWFATIMKGLGASSRLFELLDARPVSRLRTDRFLLLHWLRFTVIHQHFIGL